MNTRHFSQLPKPYLAYPKVIQGLIFKKPKGEKVLPQVEYVVDSFKTDSKHLKAYNDIFKEEEQFADNIKKTGKDINTDENIQKVVEIWEKQIEGLIELADGSDQFNTQIADIYANINKYKKIIFMYKYSK